MDSSELQLLEISRGVRKLTQIIESRSQAPDLNARSKYSTKDLLRGSLVLQDSLLIIRRLQETSRMMSQMEHNKHIVGFTIERHAEVEDDCEEECTSLRFGGLYDDTKSAIKFKLKKQSDEIATHRNMSSRENLKGITDLIMRAKAPNLIAKPWGLENAPSEAVQLVKREQTNGNHINYYKQALDNENSSNNSVGRSPVGGREDTLQCSHGNKGEMLKKKKNQSVAEMSLKNEGHRNIKKPIKRMDGGSMECSQKLRSSAFVTRKQKKKESIHMNDKVSEKRNNNQVSSAPQWQTKSIEPPPPPPNPGKAFTAEKGGVKAVGIIQSNAYRKKDSKKGEKVSIISKTIKQTGANTKSKGGTVKRTKPTNTRVYLCSSLSCSSIHHGFQKQLAENCNPCFRENTRMGAKSFCEIMPKTGKGGKNKVVSVKTAVPNCLSEAAGFQKDVKLMLLSCPEFLAEAKQMFGLDVHLCQTKAHQSLKFDEETLLNAYKLILGCAKELISRKSYQLEILNHPMSGRTYQHRQSSKAFICLEHLVEDISQGVKELNGFYRPADLKENDLYYKLERDLRCRDLFLNASWDFGWISWVCVEELDAVVDQVEEQIVSRLVVEFAFDLVH